MNTRAFKYRKNALAAARKQFGKDAIEGTHFTVTEIVGRGENENFALNPVTALAAETTVKVLQAAKTAEVIPAVTAPTRDEETAVLDMLACHKVAGDPLDIPEFLKVKPEDAEARRQRWASVRPAPIAAQPKEVIDMAAKTAKADKTAKAKTKEAKKTEGGARSAADEACATLLNREGGATVAEIRKATGWKGVIFNGPKRVAKTLNDTLESDEAAGEEKRFYLKGKAPKAKAA